MAHDLIAFVGPLQSGKTTAARYLADHYHYSRHRFAGTFKLMLKIGFNLSDEQIDGSQKDVPTELLCGRTPRYAMRTIGSQWGREMMDSEIWVQAWKNTRPPGPIVCDDCRFPNEYLLLRNLGARVFRVTRPGFEHTEEHDSEAHRLPYDEEILNEGTLKEFLHKVEGLVG